MSKTTLHTYFKLKHEKKNQNIYTLDFIEFLMMKFSLLDYQFGNICPLTVILRYCDIYFVILIFMRNKRQNVLFTKYYTYYWLFDY